MEWMDLFEIVFQDTKEESFRLIFEVMIATL